MSGLQQRGERAGERVWLTVWSFRIERHDDEKRPLPRLAVEMRGERFEGTLANGDWVEVEPSWGSGLNHVTRIQNLTARCAVVARRDRISQLGRLLKLAVALCMLVVVATVAIHVLGSRKARSPVINRVNVVRSH